MSEIERLYFTYLDMKQYGNIAYSVMLVSMVLSMPIMFYYFVLRHEIPPSSKTNWLITKVPALLFALDMASFAISVLAIVYFFTLKSFAVVDIEKICISYTHPVCEKEL